MTGLVSVLFLLCFGLVGSFSTPKIADAAAGINHQISFQGKLVNPDGTNVTDGSYSIVFSIYTVASGGSNIWTETQSVTLSNGIFQVNLGSVTTLPGSIDFNTDNIYLGIKVGADAEMTPRVQFTAVPQAFNAEKLGGLDKTGFIQNSTSLQASANLYIQSSAAGNVTAKLRAATSQTADILQVRDSSDTTTVFAISPAGTITAGTWNGNIIGGAYGGTGISSYTTGDLLFASGTTTLSKLSDVATGSCLVSGGVGVAPSWNTTCGNGVNTVGAFSASSQANGATITSNTITFGPADITNPGMVTATGSQTFGGNKTFNGSVTIAGSQSLKITGSGTRPGSPTPGMLYYDTTTNQLLQWNGTKWVSDRSPATKIIAPSSASQTAKDSADVVLTGTADQNLINTTLTAAAGGRVYIMEGTVTITGSISVPNNTTLAGAGAGTLITIPNAFNGTIDAITNTTAGGSGTGITIQGLRLDGNKSNQTAGFMRGIYLIGVGSGTGSGAIQGARVTDVIVSNWYSSRAGIWLDTSANNIFTNITSQGNDGDGFYIVSSSNNQFGNNVSQGNALTGFNINTGTSNTFVGNSAQGNTNTGFYVDGTDSTYTGNTSQSNAEGFHLNSDNNTITGNTIQTNSSYGIYVISSNNTISSNKSSSNSSGIYVSGSYNTINGNTITASSSTGVALDSANKNTITGNNSQNNGNDGFSGFASSDNTFSGNNSTGNTSYGYRFVSSSNNNVINGNKAMDNGGSTDNNGIYLDSSDSNSITSNYVSDTNGHTTTNYAINIFNSTSDTNYLAGNNLGGGSINDAGTGTIYGGQLDSGGNYTVQPAGVIELQANTQVKPTTSSATAFQVLNTAGNAPITISTAADSQNLITNPGFEINTTGWALKGAAAIARSTAQHYFGQASLAITTTAAANDGASYLLVLAANTQYSHYFDVYSASSVTGVQFGYSADGLTEATYVTTTNLSAGWNHVYMNFTTPAIVNAAAYFFVKQTDATARTFYIDDVEVDTKAFGSPTNVVSGGYVENVVSIGGNNSVATSLGINTTNPVGALEVDQKFGQMGFVLKGAGLNNLQEPLAFSIWNGDNTLAVSYAEVLRSTTVRGGSAFWNSAALQVNTVQTGAVGLRVTGMGGQTGDLIQARDSNNKNVFSVGTAGDTQIGKGTILPTTTKSVKSTSSGTFATKVDYGTGTGPRGLTSSDFNNDGFPDLAVANNGTTTVSVLINNGNGTYATKVDYTTGAVPRDVAAADFNNDGFPDLVVTNNGTTTVSVFINNGNGTFAAKVDYTVGTAPIGVAAADFNSDGFIDLAVANNTSSTASILLNGGTGTFSLTSSGPTGTAPIGITAADFNGDGKADLAVANSSSTTVSVFINTGGGTFAAKVDYTTGTTPRDVTAADFNGDGKVDLAVTNNGTTTLSVFLNTGNGIFATKVDYTTGANPYDIAAADFNGDGKVDLAVANNGAAGAGTTMSVLLGSGTGTFAAKVDYSTGSNPQGITAADFNGDGFPDLGVSSNTPNTISVFINVVSKGFSSSTTAQQSAKQSVISDSGKVGLLVQGASTSDNIFQAQDSTGQLLASIDGTGKLTVGGGPVYQAQLSVDGHVSFAAKVDYATGTNPNKVASADFNGDGKPDIAVTNSGSTTMSVFMNNGNGTFATKVDYATGTTPTGVTSADFNGDGKPDLAVTNNGSTTMSVFINTGTGTFAAKVDYTTGTSPSGVTSVDFNGDGIPDLAVTNFGATSVSVFLNTGTGTFAAKVDYTAGSQPQSITSADFNGDGYPDMATANAASTSVSVFINNGNGTFAAKVDYTTGSTPRSITSADFNGDGKPDIAVSNAAASTMSVFINNGNGTFAAKVDYSSVTNSVNITSADLNGDGYPDIAVTDGNGGVGTTMAILINNGNGTFATRVNYTSGSAPFGLTAADLNGDGKLDIAVANNTATSMSVFMNNSTDSISPVSKGTLSVTTADGSSGGLYIQGAVNQTADLLVIQNSNGNELFSVSASGLTTAKQLVVRSDAVSTNPVYPARTLLIDNGIGSSQNAIGFAVGGRERATLRADNGGSFVLNSSGSGALYLNWDAGTGGVVIGQSTNRNNLTINGTGATCTLGAGVGATNCTSDARLKNIVGEATGNLGKLMQLQPTYFTWKDPSMDQGTKLGLIAQNVQEQFPQFVITDINGNLALDYAALVTPIIGAVQEQQTEIEALGTSVTTANLNVSGAATVANLTVTGDAMVQGKLIVLGDVETRNLMVNGHIVIAGNAPVVAIGDAAGQAAANESAPVAVVDGNDSVGTLNVTTGSLSLTSGVLAHINFAQAFGDSYKVVLSASNDPAGLLRVHTIKTSTGFDIVANDTVSALTQYSFDYIVLGSNTTQ